MVEIEIWNFQSIEHVSLKLDGYTALVGRTNIGKSALIRAVKAALTGARGNAFVRHGAACLRRTKGFKACKCKSVVEIKGPQFHLKWEKGDDDNTYTFNGKELTAPGTGFPEFLAPGFAPLQLGEGKKLLQISDQFSPIFLLNETGSTVANILSDVARLDAVNVAMKMVEKDRKEAASLRKTREKDVVELAARLDVYDGLDKALHQADTAASRLVSLEALGARSHQADGYCSRQNEATDGINALNGVEKLVLPNSVALKKQASLYGTVLRLYANLLDKGRAVKGLLGINDVQPPEYSSLVSAAEAHRLVLSLVDSLEDKASTVSDLHGVDELLVPSTERLKEQAKVWLVAAKLASRLEGAAIGAQALDGVDALYVPDTSALVAQGQTSRLVSSWLSSLSAYRTWFDARKDIESASLPDIQALRTQAASYRNSSDLTSRLATISASIMTLEQAEAAAHEEHRAAEKELSEFIEDARAKGLLCPSCSQPMHLNPHELGRKDAHEPHLIAV